MTPEQVSALSDTELNRAMIWLYPPTDGVIYNGAIDMYMARYRSMDYLTSYDLTMPLAVENKLTIDLEPESEYDEITVYDVIGSVSAQTKDPLRAICEVLVLIKYQ